MSNSLVRALFLSACILPIAAHADTIDDFVISGGGNTITFSLPASPPGNMSTCPPVFPSSCLPGSETDFTASTLVTINGLSEEETITFPTFRFGGGLLVDGFRYLSGSFNSLYVPDAANPTFVPGTFFLVPEFGDPSLQAVLTITPENSTVPEPSSLVLLITGALGLVGFAGVKRRTFDQ